VRRLGGYIPAALIVLALLGAWELYVDLGGVTDLLLASPHQIALSLYDDRSLLWSNFLVTAQEVAGGVALALVVGFGLALALHLFTTLRRSLYPLLVGSQAVPILVLAPLLVYWWGFGIGPKLAVIVLVCFFPIVVTTLDGLAAVDRDQLKLLRTLDASRLQAFRYAEAPAAVPAAISGAKISLAIAVIGAFFAEYTGSTAGLGHLVLTSTPQLETARAWAAVVVLTLFAIACFYVLALAERRLAPWAHQPKGAMP
jgi:putative hydroxymethylpyrimidine transport system permease protein